MFEKQRQECCLEVSSENEKKKERGEKKEKEEKPRYLGHCGLGFFSSCCFGYLNVFPRKYPKMALQEEFETDNSTGSTRGKRPSKI